jgi:LuxR family maltose regulon positive regulatory protein
VSETLLQTKLYIPALRPSYIQRKQLLNKLNDRLKTKDKLFNRKLTLVSAPPGFGKTTLVSSWIHQLDQPAAWLSLDEGDNEKNRFLFYLVTALQETYRELGGTTISLLQSPQPPPFDTLLTVLINDLVDLTGQAILVLDDYHVIHNLEVHKAITFLLDNQPPQLHLVIIGREDPVLPLHRLRVSGQMAGIYTQDLRFTVDEAAKFLNETMGLNLGLEEVTVLERRTEGWVAGLQLAALSMQDLPDTREFVSSFAGDDRYITDYLLGEVVERQSPQVQEFLLKTAIFDRFCAPLCEAVLGAGGWGLGAEEQGQKLSSQVIIERLDQANLFVIPLDNKREWYRYHHLFADFLLMRLREREASQITDLHRRAAAWYEENDLLAEAIDHALKAKDFQRASRLIEQNALTTIFGHAQWATLFEWMETLPAEMVRARPRLSLQYAWALFTTGRWEAAANLVEEIKPVLEAVEQGAEKERLLGELSVIAALVAYSHGGDMKRCTEEARQALLLLSEDNLTLRCVALLSIGEAAMIQEDAPVARRSLQDAADVALAAGNIAIVLFALGDLARLEMTEGYLHRAAELYQRVRPLGTIEGGTILGPTGITCIQMGEVLREWNDLKKAESVLREGLTLCRQLTGLPNIVLEGQVNLARVMQASGDEELAAETMQEAENLLADMLGQSGDPRPMISLALAGRLRYWLARGEIDRAARWLDDNGISFDAAISPGELAYHVLLARILIEQGRLDKAQRQLERLEKINGERESPRLALEISILKALLYRAKGDRDQAETNLIQALQLAEPERYLRLFVDQGEPIVPLLEQLAGRRPIPSNLKAILSVVQGEPSATEKSPPAEGLSPKTSVPVEPLKEQEIQILRMMAAGRTNREIADELYLSVNTIKVYASRLYSKLGVHRRGEAVAWAQELGLI